MEDEIERLATLIDESERDWEVEPAIDQDGWRHLASLAQQHGMLSAAAGCLAAAGEWPEHRRWFSIREDFDASVNAIGEKHGFPSLSAHHDVCFSLHLLACTMPPHVETSDGVVGAPQGATSWRDLRRKMPGWMSRVRKSEPDFLYLLALELHSDDASFAAAGLADARRRLTALLLRLETIVMSTTGPDIETEQDEMTAILELMTEICGKGGRPAHGSRRRECAVTAKEAWKAQLGNEPSVVFVRDPTTYPTSPFAMWFCDAMNYIDGWSIATCREIILKTRSKTK